MWDYLRCAQLHAQHDRSLDSQEGIRPDCASQQQLHGRGGRADVMQLLLADCVLSFVCSMCCCWLTVTEQVLTSWSCDVGQGF